LLYRQEETLIASSFTELRLLFLDVDGVLNRLFGKKLLPDKLQLIGRVCEQASAQIVLSTNWREKPALREELLQTLAAVEGITVVGQTPSSMPSRASQIREFLSIPLVAARLRSWVVIDDQDLLTEAAEHDRTAVDILRGRFVRTKSQIGLTQVLADEAVAVLTASP
jgi:hypothetical protein